MTGVPAAADSAPLTLGTAGHIDHGKTALVTALTGRNTDRLAQERERGISIELGYAPLTLPSGRRLSVVDVPGHERFVRTMVAGASGIDLFLLCVAADDGVMPQTLEHLRVLECLAIDAGMVAVTKCDIGEPELVREEVGELLPEAPVVLVSALERRGLDELRRVLDDVAAPLAGRARDAGPLRLHVDRSFTLKGIGTVVTGTLWAGSVGVGDRVVILPRGLGARVRSVQVHDRGVERALAGQRVALNLGGVDRREVVRGDVVTAAAGELRPSYLVDVAATLSAGVRPLRRGARVHAHHGTREAPARVVPLDGYELHPGATAYAQLRLESPLVAARGDRLVLRQVAPPDTVGGGVVIDPRPRKHGASRAVVARLDDLVAGRAPQSAGGEPSPDSARAPRSASGPEPAVLDDAALRLLELLRADAMSPRVDGELAVAAGLAPRDAAERLKRLERSGDVVRVAHNLHYHREPLRGLEERIVALCERDGKATIAGVRDDLGTSRKYAQALLEHLDREKVTRREGDHHVLRRRGPHGAD